MSTPASPAAIAADTATVGTGAVARPAWRRARYWAVVAVVLLAGALTASAIPGAGSGPLDPDSAHPDGSKAIVQTLRDYGVAVRSVDTVGDLDDATGGSAGTIVVTLAQAWSAAQLRQIASAGGRVVLLAPSQRELDAMGAGLTIIGTAGGPRDAGCAWPGATAAGPVDLPPGTERYRANPGAQACYDGTVVLDGDLAVLGSAALLRNDTVGRDGVAALDMNVITADGTTGQVTWLLPGATGTGSAAAPSMWQLFPDGVHRVVVWLIAVAVLLTLVRARRFGPVVSEPLPVVVRAAELIEGHGRLYRRAGARDRAAQALRAGAARRLQEALGLPRGATMPALVAATARASGGQEAAIVAVLAGPPPADDAALVRLARRLADLESDALHTWAAAGMSRPEGAQL